MILRLGVSAILGGLIGFEREWNNHAAGFRTHILVCLGATLIMLLSIYGFSAFVAEANVRIDPARLAAQVISGIGFLGAGAILRNGSVISGLTTAASIWVVAAIGLCVGAGFLSAAVICTLMVLFNLLLLNKWEKRILGRRRNLEIRIEAFDRAGVIGKIAAAFHENGIQILNMKVESTVGILDATSRTPTVRFSARTKAQNLDQIIPAIGRLRELPDIIRIDYTGDVKTDFQESISARSMHS
ncbi:MAG TPA: MgtC/SapB family protein [Bacilli bacterium]